MAINKHNWQPPQRIENQYSWAINALIDMLFDRIDWEDPLSFLRIDQFTESKTFLRAAENIATRMVTAVAVHNAQNWREAAMKGTKGREIYQALQQEMHGPIGDLVRAQIDRNAFYITSTPLDISRQLTAYILEQQQRGRRAEDIAEDLQLKVTRLTKSRINLIARTEVAKASTALTRARSHELGLDWYVWRTAKDARVRDSHRHMDGVLISWTDPASPELLIGEKNQGKYAPGETYNCRCYPEPLISTNYLSWPMKVYGGGVIRRMTKSQFESVAA
jgi:SPP1 gp7 family putative phage head morphogenesis protein